MKPSRPIQWLLSLLLVLGVFGDGLASSFRRQVRSGALANDSAAIEECCGEFCEAGLDEQLTEEFSCCEQLCLVFADEAARSLDGLAPYEALLCVAPQPSGFRLPLRI